MRATLYTSSTCPFCHRARALLQQHGVEFEEHILDRDPEQLMKLKQQYRHWTVPIVLLDGEFIGGCDELEMLARRGDLSG